MLLNFIEPYMFSSMKASSLHREILRSEIKQYLAETSRSPKRQLLVGLRRSERLHRYDGQELEISTCAYKVWLTDSSADADWFVGYLEQYFSAKRINIVQNNAGERYVFVCQTNT
ncbi:MAG: hypothetical protein ACAI35_04480 [Candidatus Methylacidiphilales bacterium]|nr:hypothetical protein [Candidatus Methylacidiphilales bacterium]